MLTSKRVRWMISTISDSLRVKDTYVEEQIKDKNKVLLEKFLEGDGPPKLIVFYQIQDTNNNDDIKDSSAEPTLFFTYGEAEKLKEKAIWFVR